MVATPLTIPILSKYRVDHKVEGICKRIRKREKASEEGCPGGGAHTFAPPPYPTSTFESGDTCQPERNLCSRINSKKCKVIRKDEEC